MVSFQISCNTWDSARVEEPEVEHPGVEELGVEHPRVEEPGVEHPEVEEPEEHPGVGEPRGRNLDLRQLVWTCA